MPTIQEITETPTVLTAGTEQRNADGTSWYRRAHFHESLMRSWAILDYVQDLLEKGASNEAVLVVLRDLRALPGLEVDGGKFS